jgi:hypothetical protein
MKHIMMSKMSKEELKAAISDVSTDSSDDDEPAIQASASPAAVRVPENQPAIQAQAPPSSEAPRVPGNTNGQDVPKQATAPPADFDPKNALPKDSQKQDAVPPSPAVLSPGEMRTLNHNHDAISGNVEMPLAKHVSVPSVEPPKPTIEEDIKPPEPQEVNSVSLPSDIMATSGQPTFISNRLITNGASLTAGEDPANTQSWVPVAEVAKPNNAILVKPLGLVAAGIVGLATFCGVLWLGNKIKKKKERGRRRERRHIRDWMIREV